MFLFTLRLDTLPRSNTDSISIWAKAVPYKDWDPHTSSTVVVLWKYLRKQNIHSYGEKTMEDIHQRS